MNHIFISYSHKDKEYVEKLEKKLIEEGFNVWIDHRIDYGSQWPKEIQRQLDACDAFIVVMSENAYESEWVQNEVARAKRKNKPFFPLLLQGEPWLSVEATQYVDVSDGSLPPEKFYARLSRHTQNPKTEFAPGSEIRGSTYQIDNNTLIIMRVFQVTDKYFDEKSEPQKIVIQFTNIDESETITINKIRFSDTGLGLPSSALLASYSRENKGQLVIPFEKDKRIVLPGQNFTIELCLGQIWRRADINKWAGDWVYLRIDIEFKGRQVEWFSSI